MHDESKLPQWVQQRLAELREESAALQRKIEALQNVHALTANGREWFTVSWPSLDPPGSLLHLWVLDRDHPFPVCSIGDGDVLLIGRATRKKEDVS